MYPQHDAYAGKEVIVERHSKASLQERNLADAYTIEGRFQEWRGCYAQDNTRFERGMVGPVIEPRCTWYWPEGFPDRAHGQSELHDSRGVLWPWVPEPVLKRPGCPADAPCEEDAYPSSPAKFEPL